MEGIDEYMYIWQRRIHHGVRYQKSSVPFPESVEIGLEFNAALERKEKLDLSLLTNGVMLELCDFAKTVTKSETYFLFEMLEFNFDLGVDVDDDCQCYEYARRTHGKIKQLREQIKLKPRRWKDAFPLPDLSVVVGSAGSQQPGRYYPKRNKTVDSSVLSDGSKSSQSAEQQRTETTGSAFVVKKRGGVLVKLTADAFPFCKDLGVSLVVRPDDANGEKLNPNLVTNGVMLELLDFSRVLCGTHTGIVLDLVEQNFGHRLDNTLFRLQVSKVMDRKYSCLTAEDRDAFRKEEFRVQTQKREQKRKRSDPDYEEPEGPTTSRKRRLSLRDEDAKDVNEDGDLSYMCPVEFETDMQSESEVGAEEVKVESCLSETKDVKQEEEEVFVSPQVPDIGPRPIPVRLKNPSLNAVSDLFSEDRNEDVNVKTEKQKLWVRRATRSKQILKSSRVNDLFASCRDRGLDFNVGSGNRQNVDLQLFTNCVLWEVYKFATAMTKSLRSFLVEILDNNFNLVLQDELHQRNFIFYMITKEKVLQNHPNGGKAEFLKSPFQFPDVYNMVDVTSNFQNGQEVETEQQTELDLPATSQEPHPYCKKIGLDLWSTEGRPLSQKLDLTVLTTGAVLELFTFIRELCGSVRETVNDVLEHNFDLDLQSAATEASQVIHRWYTTQKSLMKRQTPSPKISRWLNTLVPLNSHSEIDPEPPAANGSEDLVSETDVLNGEVEPEEEKVHSYHFCEQIGLDLDVVSKRKAKTKLDLRVLTRGVLFEMHRYVARNCNRYVPALYEILEYNFDLSSQKHRKVEFAWAVASQVVTIAGKNGRKGDYLSRAIQLPVHVSESSQGVCKEEPEDGFTEPDLNDNNDIVFVQELKPVDIEVVID
ncbi:uncharacterized protein LOC129113232 [Anoplopoma fimbria]|uniref:uncharacterized protein LOC129113232 n=1 Tax=Anoplopoma fimbria TaxID=229290 RepID=UPI0023ED46EB|nr:uncharacterized protein LOC129113232 [Anoplopoma fimbria]XP_054481422.1 uncharacterized protein LOC129113232 [Anoplopoma fimbria]